ncbi:MAG: Na/Pi cotransporter family protein [Pseudomonadota bacterium]
MNIFDIIQLLGGVGLFLYAIRLLSESLQLLAGDSLKNLIGMLTKTPVLGVFVGALVTVLIQSSSATTVMSLSFVDAGLMTLHQAIGVIMGANIGTTVTGQIIAFKIKDFAYLFIIIGALLTIFGRTERLKYLGNGLLGFGLLFVGMQTMEGSMSVLRTRSDLFLAFSHNPLMGLLAGTVLTLLVQSSSATVGLTIALGMQGLLPLEAAIPIILGDNLGTTITAIIASLGSTRSAKQACLAHVLFNVIGVCIFLPLLPVYIDFIAASADSIGHQIANAHTLFNVTNALILLPFVGVFEKLIKRILPDTKKPHIAKTFLDPKLIDVSPSIATQAVRNESLYMGSVLLECIDDLEELLFYGDKDKRALLKEKENKLDELHHDIQAYAQRVMRAGIASQDVMRVHSYVARVSDMERIGDSCRSILYMLDNQHDGSLIFKGQALEEIQAMFDQAKTAVEIAVQNISLPHTRAMELVPEVAKLAIAVRNAETTNRQQHMQRLAAEECTPSTAALTYFDMLSALENIAYRAKKMCQVIP